MGAGTVATLVIMDGLKLDAFCTETYYVVAGTEHLYEVVYEAKSDLSAVIVLDLDNDPGSSFTSSPIYQQALANKFKTDYLTDISLFEPDRATYHTVVNYARTGSIGSGPSTPYAAPEISYEGPTFISPIGKWRITATITISEGYQHSITYPYDGTYVGSRNVQF